MPHEQCAYCNCGKHHGLSEAADLYHRHRRAKNEEERNRHQQVKPDDALAIFDSRGIVTAFELACDSKHVREHWAVSRRSCEDRAVERCYRAQIEERQGPLPESFGI